MRSMIWKGGLGDFEGGYEMGWGVEKEKIQLVKIVVPNSGYNTYGQARPRLDSSAFLSSQPWD